MARQELGNERTTMYAEGVDLVVERVFDAPRDAVWTAMTSPEHVPQWLGPHGTSTTLMEWDVQSGGKWRWANKFDGGEARFAGEHIEVVAPEKLVRTSGPDMEPAGPPAVETITFTESGGKTTMTNRTRFPSEEVLGFALDSGMTVGILEQFDRLDDLLKEMR